MTSSPYSDIAIVQLEEPVKLSPQIYPICLPDFEDPNPDSMSGKTATLVGYGPKTETSTKVNEFWPTVQPQRLCSSKYNPDKALTFQLRHEPLN